MKKIIIFAVVMLLVGCAEKQEYEQVVSEQMVNDKEIKDYKIDPELMTKCVVKTTSENMPGLFPIDPARMTAYKNYAKMLKMSTSSDPKKTLEELRVEFGSPKALAEAHANYTESVLNCMSGIVTDHEQELTHK